VIHNSR